MTPTRDPGSPLGQKSSHTQGASERVLGILDELEAKKAFLFRDGRGAVVWAYPVTAAETPHRLFFKSGDRLYAA